jgi:hypothetical protein
VIEELVDDELLYRMDGLGWAKDVPPDHSNHQDFNAPTGPNHTLAKDASPLQYFALFIPCNRLLSGLCTRTPMQQPLWLCYLESPENIKQLAQLN